MCLLRTETHYEKSMAIILLTTLALTLVGPALLQQVKAVTSGQNGMAGIPGAQCLPHYRDSLCFTDGGMGGSGNEPNYDDFSNGNGGNGNNIIACTSDYDGDNDCSANGGEDFSTEVLFMILIYEQQKMINELITRLAEEKTLRERDLHKPLYTPCV
jgi:hypothetical protein